MPTKPPKVCKRAGCQKVDPSGWCEDHASGRHAWRGHGGQSSTERGYGSEWRRLRAMVLDRDGGLCQVCKRAGRLSLAQEVDHIKPKAAGGTDALENLQSICKPCHKEKTISESH